MPRTVNATLELIVAGALLAAMTGFYVKVSYSTSPKEDPPAHYPTTAPVTTQYD